MRIIDPIAITPDMAVPGDFLVQPDSSQFVVEPNDVFQVPALYTNVPENDYVPWASGTAYVVGDRTMRNHHNYEALTNNTNKDPAGTPTSPATWLDLGFTNRWRMFDDKIGTQTTNPETIEVRIAPQKPVDAVAFFGVDAATVTVRAVDPYLGIVFESSVSAVSTDGIEDWYSYFFNPIELYEDFVALDIPAGTYGSIDITISKPSGVAAIGALILGKTFEIGCTRWGATVGITDYSRKDKDDFGNFIIVERGYSKRGDFDLAIETPRVAGVQRTLSKYRAKPIVWIGEAAYPSTIIYGYYREFNLVISGPKFSDCSISVEGLV